MPPTLPPRQLDALRWIAQFIATQAYPPTVREIGAALGLRSTNGVNDHLKALERKGVLVRPIRGHSGARALRITDAGRAVLAAEAAA